MSMTVVIGSASTASFGTDTCVISANWSFNPGRQDAFCLGSWTPSTDHIIYKPQQTLSLTIYAPGPSYNTEPSNGCEVANTIMASVSPQSCTGSISDISGDWHVTSYNYSKGSKDQPGQESWSLTKWKGVPTTGMATTNVIEPEYVIRGISQGQSTDASVAGIVFDSTFAESEEGSVSAGGTGQASTITHGVVSNVGGGSSDVSDLGNGSASISYTPLYI